MTDDDSFATRLDAEFRRRGIDPLAPSTDDVIARLGMPLAALISSVRAGGMERWRVLAALLAAAAAELDDSGARFATDRIAAEAVARADDDLTDVTAMDPAVRR